MWANSQIGHNAPDEWSKPTEHKNDGASTVAQTDGGERLTAWKTRALEVTPLTHQIGGTAALSNDVSLVPAMGSGVSGGSGWRKAVVPESGHVYYYNDQTGESSWAIPIDYVPPNDQTGESTWDSTWDVPVDYVPPTPRRSVSGPTAPTALVASRRTSFRQRHRPRRRSSVEATRARQMWKKAGMMTRATVRFKSSGARPAKDSTRTVVGSVGIVARNPVDLGKSRATSSDWEELMDSTTGQKYYFSHERQEVSWTNPLFQASKKPAGGGGARGATPTPEVAERTASSSGGRQISSEWEELVDGRTGEIYFYNRMMQQVSWTNPLVAVPGAQGGNWGSAPTVEEANRASKSRSRRMKKTGGAEDGEGGGNDPEARALSCRVEKHSKEVAFDEPVTYEKHLEPASGYVYNINPRTKTTHWDGERDEEGDVPAGDVAKLQSEYGGDQTVHVMGGAGHDSHWTAAGAQHVGAGPGARSEAPLSSSRDKNFRHLETDSGEPKKSSKRPPFSCVPSCCSRRLLLGGILLVFILLLLVGVAVGVAMAPTASDTPTPCVGSQWTKECETSSLNPDGNDGTGGGGGGGGGGGAVVLPPAVIVKQRNEADNFCDNGQNAYVIPVRWKRARKRERERERERLRTGCDLLAPPPRI